jgi:quinol monooxygenase YgiN
MFAVIRLRPGRGDAVEAALAVLLDVLTGRPGFRSASLGRAADDPELWALVLRWADIGSYRRALSAPEVRMAFGPVQSWILDEPSAYEVVAAET